MRRTIIIFDGETGKIALDMSKLVMVELTGKDLNFTTDNGDSETPITFLTEEKAKEYFDLIITAWNGLGTYEQ